MELKRPLSSVLLKNAAFYEYGRGQRYMPMPPGLKNK